MDVDEWLIVPSLCKQSMRVNPVRERGTPTRAEVAVNGADQIKAAKRATRET